MTPELREQLKRDPILWVRWCFASKVINLMHYKLWLRSSKRNPFHPRSERVMRRRLGRWIRRFEKKHGMRSKFRDPETARQFGGKF